MTAFQSIQSKPPASAYVYEPEFWQRCAALALDTRKIGASSAVVSSVAKQLARLAATAALADTNNTAPAADAASDFTQALKACSGK